MPLALVLLCAACGSSTFTDTATFEGRLLDAAGRPLPDVSIELRPGGGATREIRTDAKGRFQGFAYFDGGGVFGLGGPAGYSATLEIPRVLEGVSFSGYAASAEDGEFVLPAFRAPPVGLTIARTATEWIAAGPSGVSPRICLRGEDDGLETFSCGGSRVDPRALEDYPGVFVRAESWIDLEEPMEVYGSFEQRVPVASGTAVPLSRGAPCWFDDLRQDPCPLTDGERGSIEVPDRTFELRIELPQTTPLSHVFLHDTLIEHGGELNDLVIEGSTDGVSYTRLGRAEATSVDTWGYEELGGIALTGAAKIVRIRLAPRGVRGFRTVGEISLH